MRSQAFADIGYREDPPEDPPEDNVYAFVRPGSAAAHASFVPNVPASVAHIRATAAGTAAIERIKTMLAEQRERMKRRK